MQNYITHAYDEQMPKIFYSTIIKKKNLHTIRKEDENVVLTTMQNPFLLHPTSLFLFLAHAAPRQARKVHIMVIPIFIAVYCQYFGKFLFQRCQPCQPVFEYLIHLQNRCTVYKHFITLTKLKQEMRFLKSRISHCGLIPCYNHFLIYNQSDILRNQ